MIYRDILATMWDISKVSTTPFFLQGLPYIPMVRNDQAKVPISAPCSHVPLRNIFDILVSNPQIEVFVQQKSYGSHKHQADAAPAP